MVKNSYKKKRTKRIQSVQNYHAMKFRLARAEALRVAVATSATRSSNYVGPMEAPGEENDQNTVEYIDCEDPSIVTCPNENLSVMMDITEEDQTVKSIKLEGRRIIGGVSILEFAQKVYAHGKECGKEFNFARETAHHGGLCREQVFKCICGWKVQLESDTGNESLPVNKALTYGTLAAAVGYDAIATVLTTMDLPVPSKNCFTTHLRGARDSFSSALNDEIRKAGEQEKALAVAENEFVCINGELVPWIDVKTDGGWGKRTYGHGYDSNSGVAVIIGCRTGKIIFIGTRTKTCYKCSLAANKGQKPSSHECNKNWSGTSTSMEADIISEGFRRSLEMHGVVYKRFVGDGDSSVHSAVENVYAGIKVQKVECYNHALKNFIRKLNDISTDSVKGKSAPRIPREERQIPGIEDKFKRINMDVRSAIIYNHNFQHIPNQDQELSKDIYNVLRHVFGDHSQCKQYFCDPDNPKRNEPNEYHLMTTKVMWTPLLTAVSKLASMSSSLIQKKNTNSAECFMSIANKYTEGKRKNFGSGFLYSLRMTCAAFSFNKNRFWVADVYRNAYQKEPLSGWLKMEKREVLLRQRVRTRKPKKPVSYGFLKSGKSKGDKDYGSNPDQPDMSIELRTSHIRTLHETLMVDESSRREIEEATRDQSNCDVWFSHRRTRVTASVAGRVFKLKPTSDNTSILNGILRQHNRSGTIAMQYGIKSEELAIAAYEKETGLEKGTVKKVGLMVSLEDGVLGASPDGLIGSEGILEVKCPFSIRDSTPQLWWKLSKDCPLSIQSGKLALKPTHNHFFQILMQLFVTGRKWVDYFIWTPHGNFLQRIERNEDTAAIWNKMKEKLVRFWEQDMAPELVDSRMKRNRPDYWCSEERLVGRKRNAAAKEKRQGKISSSVN